MPTVTTKRRRIKADTIQGASSAAQQAAELLEADGLARWPSDVVPRPPVGELRDRADEIFRATLLGRAPADWSAIDLICAARYSANMAVQISDEALLIRTGSVVQTEKGFTANPLLSVCVSRGTLIQAIARQLGTASPAVDKRATANAARKVNKLADHMRCIDDDGLLAGFHGGKQA